ncbi:MAG: hypothetical protein ACI8TQ_003738 [Planctomycetota bacterium]|jgi:hypothetical protein
MDRLLTPPYTPYQHTDASLAERGYVVLAPGGLARLLDSEQCESPLGAWTQHWGDLPLDQHLRDGGEYRRRRHSSFIVESGEVQQVAHRAHWQPIDYNALHGGMERWFEPLAPELVDDPVWSRLLVALTERAVALRNHDGKWFVEAHAFRIDTNGGIGRPTPEGAHRDGVDLVAVILIDREGIKGGETRVFDANGPNGQRFTMSEPGTAMLIDDARTIHETTPIQPEVPGGGGQRDTLVLTWRSDGFQDP